MARIPVVALILAFMMLLWLNYVLGRFPEHRHPPAVDLTNDRPEQHQSGGMHVYSNDSNSSLVCFDLCWARSLLILMPCDVLCVETFSRFKAYRHTNSSIHRFAGFSVSRFSIQGGRPRTTAGPVLKVMVPLWAPPLLLAIYPTIAFIRFIHFIRGPLRCRRRRKRGMCLSCGYNLTGNTSGVCPECAAKVEG